MHSPFLKKDRIGFDGQGDYAAHERAFTGTDDDNHERTKNHFLELRDASYLPLVIIFLTKNTDQRDDYLLITDRKAHLLILIVCDLTGVNSFL